MLKENSHKLFTVINAIEARSTKWEKGKPQRQKQKFVICLLFFAIALSLVYRINCENCYCIVYSAVETF